MMSSTASTLTFTERYAELHDLGYQDWRIAKRLRITLSSHERQLERYGLAIDGRLREMAHDERSSRRPPNA